MKMKKAKRLAIVGLTIAAMLTLTACGTSTGQSTGSAGSASSGAHITLRLADDQPTNYPTVAGDQKFADLVKQRSNGRITVTVYPNAQLGDEATVAEQVQLGAIDFARINASPLASFDKQLNVLNLPYLFNSSQQMWDVLNGPIGDQILSTLSTAKMVGLTYYDSGARSFYNSKHAVVHPSDLKGMKIRVQQSPMYIDLVKALGASPTPMAYGDVYGALQTGVIDGAENNWPSYYSTNHYQVAKYFTEDDHTRTPEILLASQTSWNKLSAADQKLIMQAAKDSQAAERTSWTQLENKAKQEVTAHGNVISKVDVAEWQKAVQPLYDKYGSEFKDIIAKIRATK